MILIDDEDEMEEEEDNRRFLIGSEGGRASWLDAVLFCKGVTNG